MEFVRRKLGSDLGKDHPILAGWAALVAVTLVIGLMGAFGTLAATRVLGLGGAASGADQPGAGPTLYVPDPGGSDEPAPSNDASATAPVTQPTEPSASATPEAPPIQLQADPGRVGSFERINLTGSYPSGDGSILQVQRKESGRWVDFAVTASVQGGDFTTYVQTSRPGLNAWRMRDTDSGAVSNVVRVTVG